MPRRNASCAQARWTYFFSRVRDVRAQADEAVVRAAVAQSAAALRFASDALRADRAVVALALAQSGWALRDAAEALRGDKEVVAAAVRKNGGALHYASPALQVVLLAS